MTDKELLDCLKDRPCKACKFHEEDGCTQWNCVFDEALKHEPKKQSERLQKIIKILEEEEASFRADYHDSISCPFEQGVLSAFEQFRLMILKESEG